MSRKTKQIGSDPDLAALCAALAESAIATEKVPSGWFTIAQLSEEYRRERSTVTNRMKDLIARGKAEMCRFRVMTGRGVYPVPHYRLLKANE
jgi:predicted transcriptional regulator